MADRRGQFRPGPRVKFCKCDRDLQGKVFFILKRDSQEQRASLLLNAEHRVVTECFSTRMCPSGLAQEKWLSCFAFQFAGSFIYCILFIVQTSEKLLPQLYEVYNQNFKKIPGSRVFELQFFEIMSEMKDLFWFYYSYSLLFLILPSYIFVSLIPQIIGSSRIETVSSLQVRSL